LLISGGGLVGVALNKKNIKENVQGLVFINGLRPVLIQLM